MLVAALHGKLKGVVMAAKRAQILAAMLEKLQLVSAPGEEVLPDSLLLLLALVSLQTALETLLPRIFPSQSQLASVSASPLKFPTRTN
jgi:hypothetical protein